MNKVLYILVSMACSMSSYAQLKVPTYNDKYGLDFNISREDSTSSFFHSNAMETQIGVLKFMNKEQKYEERFTLVTPKVNTFKSVLRNRILLPDGKGLKMGNISLEAKGTNLEKLSIQVVGLNDKEEKMSNKTCTFVPDSTYSKLSCSFPVENMDMIDITIEAKGKSGKKAKVSYAGLELKIDGKSINNTPIRQLPETCLKEDKSVTTDNRASAILGKIKELEGKKIIGFGESAEHHDNIKQLVFDIMKEGVNRMGCRLLIFDISLSESLFFNRYISDTLFVLPEELVEKEWYKENATFLNTLRKYNSQHLPKNYVKLFGMNYNAFQSKDQNVMIDLFDFVAYLNKKSQMHEVDSLAIMLYDNQPANALKYINYHKVNLEKVLTQDELKCLLFCIKMKKNYTDYFCYRDSIMMENITFLTNTFAAKMNDKVMIDGHAIHLNKLSTYPVDNQRSIGSYLHERYGTSYASFILVSDKGCVKYDNRLGIATNGLLQKPVPSSIEQSMSKLGKKLCYVPITEEYNHLTLSRLSYTWNGCQFYPVNLYKRHDGIFYIKGNDAFSKHTTKVSKATMLEEMDKVEEISHKVMNKIKKRDALASEIRDRCNLHK